MNAPTISAYVYKADIYCPDCILHELGLPFENGSAEEVLNRIAMYKRLDRTVESEFDSGEFPKIAFRDWIRPEDACGRCGKELN